MLTECMMSILESVCLGKPAGSAINNEESVPESSAPFPHDRGRTRAYLLQRREVVGQSVGGIETYPSMHSVV